MKTRKNLLVVFALLGVLSACTNTTSDYQAGKTDDPYEIMKKKREYYKNLELKEEGQKMEENTENLGLEKENNLKSEEEQRKIKEEAYKILEKKREKYKN